MIRPLRRRHRWLAPLAFGGALVGLGAALVARPELHLDAGPEPAESLAGALAVVASASPHLSVVRVPSGGVGPALTVDVVPHEDLAAPDLLGYAAATAGPVGADLPPGARLLGPVSTVHRTRLTMPAGLQTLVLYSLGHRARLATLDLTPLLATEAR